MNTLVSIAIKLGWLTLAYFAPIKEVACAVGALFIIDWITGVWKSILQNKRITSFRLRKSANKLAIYFVVLIASHIACESIGLEWTNLTSVIAGYIALTEMLSILENAAVITGKDFLKEIAERLKSNVINKYLKK